MQIVEGMLTGGDLRFALCATRFNHFIVDRLVDGATDALLRHGVAANNLTQFRVPGAFELPALVQRVAETGIYDGVIALACVIRGSTPHFDYIAAEVMKGLAHISLSGKTAIGAGILTTDTIEQAIERAGTKSGNKGFEAAVTALEVANLFREITKRT